MTTDRRTLYLAGFGAVLAVAVLIAVYNLYGALGLGPIPPGKMSVLSFIGLKDLQRGQFTSEALKPQPMLAYLLGRLGMADFAALRLAILIFFAVIPLAGGLFAFLGSRSVLIGSASAVFLSLLPFSYLSAIGGDYSLVSALALVLATLCSSLLFLRGRTALWLAPSAAFAAMAAMSAASASWVLFLVSTAWALYSVLLKLRKVYALVLLPGVLALGTSLLRAPNGLEESLRQASLTPMLSGDLGLVALLGVAGFAGSISLGLREKGDSIQVFLFVGAGLVLVPFYWGEALVLVLPAVSLLVAQPLVEARKLATMARNGSSGGEDSAVVELDLMKLLAVAIALLTLSSPLVLGLGPGSALQGTSYLGAEELKALNEVQSLNPSVFGQGLVAAPPSIGPWLRAELGVDTLLALGSNQSAEADAITSTSFRLRSSYLMADEWTPFSSVRSPFVYAFDGTTYAAVLHLDDGTNAVSLSYGKQGLKDSLAGMYMFGHNFTQDSQKLTLTFQLSKLGFNVTKVITLYKDKPMLSISYVIKPNHGNTLLSLSLPVYIEGTQSIQSELSGETIHMAMTSSDVTLSFLGGSPPTLVRGGVQNYVESTFDATNGSVQASVMVAVDSAKSSGMGPFYASLLNDIANKGISSLLTFTPPQGLNFLANTIVRPLFVLDVKDSFNRVLLTSQGVNYVEAPSDATVVSQDIAGFCDAGITYKTAGLIIEKEVRTAGNALLLSYKVEPWKADTTLREMNVTLWIPWDRSVIGYHSNSSYVNLLLDSGPVGLSILSGHLIGIEVGPDPVYGQLQVLFRFSLNPSQDTVAIQMKFGMELGCQQQFSSRPVMDGSDELFLYTDYGLFEQAFTNDTFTVYRLTAQVNPNEAP